ncbi:MAG TPA: hypothetical protein VK116_20435, partial [Planctomycetota bacterium]|nr:hypothetical protein [Planctomycetota bacterium]
MRLWDLASRTEVGHLPGRRVRSVLFEREGRSLYTTGLDGIREWPLRRVGERGARMVIGPPRQLTEIAYWRRADLGDRDRRILAERDGRAHLFAVDEPEHRIELRGLPPNWYVALSADGAWAAGGSYRGDEVWLWRPKDAVAGAEIEPVRKLAARRSRVRFHPDSTRLATCSPESLTLWRVETGAPLWRIERERGATFAGTVAFSNDGKLLAFNPDDWRIWLVETATGRKLCELFGSETIKLTELALEGGTLAASTGARQIHFWDLNALGKRMAELDLPWELPVSGATLDQRSPLRVTVVERSIDSLQDEEEAIAALGSRELFRPTRAVAFRTRLGSYSDIDRALATPSFLVSEDARWSFFRGRAEPTEGLEWTEKEFSPEPAWEVGRTPISGWPAVRDVGAEGTRL